ncbi:hypothetical protein [Hydrogenophaga sp.]|uniref:hypothetical protein n=1 Tax=Hydrogenophaga sp. TaxID=1904254 RepID=UPI00275B8C20|nr:hypothetical protein [Hydrogenophaga sp.]MDP2418033.1 hypothetical protein [Hydrogenophaga sp.]
MNRCTSPLSSRRNSALALCLLAISLWPAAQAQNLPRQFPAQALRGTLVVVQPPAITLDGKPAQLSPGARIRSQNNMLAMSGALVGQELTVNYLLESHGLVHEVWILTPAETAEKRPKAASNP